MRGREVQFASLQKLLVWFKVEVVVFGLKYFTRAYGNINTEVD